MTKKDNKKDIEFFLNNKNFTVLNSEFEKEFGKVGTKKAKKSLEKSMKIFRADSLVSERKQSGLTQQQVADKLGKDKTYISKMENGVVTPSVDLFYKYVEAIGKRVEIV